MAVKTVNITREEWAEVLKVLEIIKKDPNLGLYYRDPETGSFLKVSPSGMGEAIKDE